MHAVVVVVDPGSRAPQEARQTIESNVIPRVKENPGFVAGYWLAPKDGQALSVSFYETGEQAQAAKERIRVPEGVRLVSADVRDVVTSAQGAAAPRS